MRKRNVICIDSSWYFSDGIDWTIFYVYTQMHQCIVQGQARRRKTDVEEEKRQFISF